jgi:hypothetical protein
VTGGGTLARATPTREAAMAAFCDDGATVAPADARHHIFSDLRG